MANLFSKIDAPFTPKQVTALNLWQLNSNFHPLTCIASHPDIGTLYAKRDGLHCPHCDYHQKWAPEILTVPPTPRQLTAVYDNLSTGLEDYK